MKGRIAWMLRNSKKVFVYLIAIDVLVVSLHLLFGRWWSFLHLDVEGNLPTVYQSFKLIGFGLVFLAVSLGRRLNFETKAFTIPLAVFLVALGLDELLQVHENIYRFFELFDWLSPSRVVPITLDLGYRSSLWVVYYLPVILLFVFWCGYFFRHFQSKFKNNLGVVGIIGLSLFVILATEILSSTGTHSERDYFWLITTEETAEMIFGSALVLIGSKMVERNIRW